MLGFTRVDALQGGHPRSQFLLPPLSLTGFGNTPAAFPALASPAPLPKCLQLNRRAARSLISRQRLDLSSVECL